MARLEGQLIVRSCAGFRFPLYLFTTPPDGNADQIVALYARRWQLELDLRALKVTMRLEQLRGKSREAVEKELLIAVLAYGLVRAFMAAAAHRAGPPPRRLSLTNCYGLLDVMGAQLCGGPRARQQQTLDRILRRTAQSKLPNRPRPRSYPRAVWGRGKTYPKTAPPFPHREK